MELLLENTKGNITEEIDKILTQMISELKLNYVDEKNKKHEDNNRIKRF